MCDDVGLRGVQVIIVEFATRLMRRLEFCPCLPSLPIGLVEMACEEAAAGEADEIVTLYCGYCPLGEECSRGRQKFPTKLTEEEARWPISQHLNSDAHPELDSAQAEDWASACEIVSWEGPKSAAVRKHWSAATRKPADHRPDRSRSRDRRRRGGGSGGHGGSRSGGASSSRSMVPADRRPLQLDIRRDTGPASFTSRLVSAVDAARMQWVVNCSNSIVASSSNVKV